jgi:hypothetical protein
MDKNDEFDEFLDETHEAYHIGDLTIRPSEILKQCDPDAYRTYLNNWEDSNEKE